MKVALLYTPSEKHLAKLRLVAGGAELALAEDSLESSVQALSGADAVLGVRFLREALPLSRPPQEGLRWLQTPWVGVEDLLDSLADPRTLLTNSRGLYDDEVADHALALWLAVSRGLLGARDRQREAKWERPELPSAPRTALILGLGGVGCAIARRLSACGLRVRGVRRRGPGLDTIAGVTTVVGQDEWRDLLELSGLLVLAMPLTRETRSLIGARELKRLAPGAVVVNVARGGLLDEAALLESLRSGALSGAGLDTFAEEPLPPESPLWKEPNLLVSPHLGRPPRAGPQPWETLFEQNLAKFVRSEPLVNVVDRARGY